jgi:hypothetical protein
MSDDEAEYIGEIPPEVIAEAQVQEVASLHWHYDEGDFVNVNISLCPDGNYAIVHTEDPDGDVTLIDMTAERALILSYGLRLAALRVMAKSAASDDLDRIAWEIEAATTALNELMVAGL